MACLGRVRGGTTVTSEPEQAEDLDAAIQFVGGDVTECFSGRRVGPSLCDRAVSGCTCASSLPLERHQKRDDLAPETFSSRNNPTSATAAHAPRHYP